MKAPKSLRELPGFDNAMAELIACRGKDLRAIGAQSDPSADLGAVVIPGLSRVRHWDLLWQLALVMRSERNIERRRLCAVPPLRPIAANDCEVRQ